VASVAADPSAITPPIPLPSRSDAAPPAGPSRAFADLLDAAGPSSVPGQATFSGPSARTDDGSNPTQPSAAAGTASSSALTIAAAPMGGKEPSSSKDSKDEKDNVSESSADVGTTVDLTVVAGLAIPALPLDPALPATDQSATTFGEVRTAFLTAALLPDDITAGPSSDLRAANSQSGQISAGPAAPFPDIAPMPAATAAPQGSVASIVPDTSPMRTWAIAANPSTSIGVPAAAKADLGAPPQPNGIALPTLPAPSAAQVGGPAAPAFSLMPPAELQTAATLPSIAGAADQNARSAAPSPAAIAAPANSGAPSTLAATAALNLTPTMLFSSTTQVSDQPAGNTGAHLETEDIPIPLPAQVAARFAAPPRAAGDGTSDTTSDNLPDSAGGLGGPPTATANGQPVTPSFNLAAPAPPQAAPLTSTPSQHAPVTSEAVPLAAVPIAIATRVEAGESRFEIRLDPPDLGRIEVRLNVDNNGRATSHLVADRADTLDLLRRDAPALERALQSAGLTTDDGALQFSLRDQSFAGRDQAPPAPPPPAAPASVPDSDLAPIDTATRRYGAPAGLGGGIDIRV
jgi:flagellar hook-length control protein FliK